MPPLADAVRFVNSEERDFLSRQKFKRLRSEQSLRGQVQNLNFPLTNTIGNLNLFLLAERAVNQGRINTRGGESVNLILHQ